MKTINIYLVGGKDLNLDILIAEHVLQYVFPLSVDILNYSPILVAVLKDNRKPFVLGEEVTFLCSLSLNLYID